jgi:hypothetical protein
MQMRHIVNLLMVSLLAFAQFDDLIFVDATAPSDPVTSEDDEFLPVERERVEENSPTRRRLHLGEISPVATIANRAFPEVNVFSESRPLQNSGYSCLYVFMSLRR